MGEMDRVVQTSAANAEESSSAAEELAAQAKELNAMVEAFKIDEGAAGIRNTKHLSARAASC